MRGFWLLTTAVVVAPLPAIAAPVRLAVELSGGPHAEMRIAIQNLDDVPLLVPFGGLIGSRFYSLRFRPFVTTPDGKDHELIYSGTPGIAGGRVDPLVVPLLPHATYAVEIPLTQFSILDASEKLESYIRKPCRLRVELDTHDAVCPLYGYPNPNMIRCWQGRLVSNVLELPQPHD
jgi:hypothetical protein